jgi:hypothetical protein
MFPHNPHLAAGATKLPPPPPKHLDAPEREAWTTILRHHGNFNRAGEILLENALMAMGRARQLRTLIDRDGVLLTGREGLPRKHPLLPTEASFRKLVWSTFKALRISYEEVD